MISEPKSARLAKTAHNAAQELRRSDDGEAEMPADVPIRPGSRPNHTGSRAGWLASWTMIAAFIVGGVGLTFGPRPLIWVGVGVFIAVGALGMITRAWTNDQPHREPGGREPAGAGGPSSSDPEAS